MAHFSSAPSSPKKKILIFSCKGGYGHISASLAIQELFKDKYSFQEVFPIEEMHSLGGYSGESFYNSLLKNDWIRTTNFMSNHLAPLWFQARKKSVEALIQKYIQEEKPDLILSVIPFLNGPASEAARKNQVPYLLVTTDNDLTIWSLGLDRLKPSSFKVTIGRDHELTRGLLVKKGISEDYIETIGLPIHPLFLQNKNQKLLKEEFNIPQDKPVVMLMMGGAGGKGALEYTKALERLALPFHVIVCAGNNPILYEKMQLFKSLQGQVSFSIFGFSNRIADLMQVSNLLVTKPGPGTINEAMTKHLPILVDNTNSTLSWERVNRDFVSQVGIGQILHHVEDIKQWVPKYLYDEETKRHLDWNYRMLKLPVFDQGLDRVMSSMLESVSYTLVSTAKA